MLADDISWPVAIIAFGLGQIIAGVLTGSSRSGTTIMLAMLLGLTRSKATEFTFLLGVPTLLAATGWKLLKAFKAGELHGSNATLLAIGFVVAALSSFVVVKWLIRFVQRHTFNGFAAYRVLAAALIFGALASGRMQSVPAEKHRAAPAESSGQK
jgi:undecaprenyl-diphosphatase